MKTVFCLIMSLITLVVRIPSLQRYCEKLANDVYIISEPNDDNQKSVAVRMFSR